MARGRSSSLVLVDASVLLDGALRRLLAPSGGGSWAVAVSAATLRLAEQGGVAPLGLRRARFVTVLAATASEVAAVVPRCPCDCLSRGEIESLALVVARGLRYCTEEPAVIRVMEELGVTARLVPLSVLLRGAPPGASASGETA
jgi:hypothetical protein